ncbi:MAG TPA: phosphoribosyltransferase family protein [Candidatus Elarobacter sp.]|jgi:predicted phosphoribosyltransferase
MDVEPLFADRRAAGHALAGALNDLAGRDDVIVLGLPRGGVAVGAEVARALGAPLDVAVVRKLGVPGAEELALGALAFGGVAVYNPDVIAELGIPPAMIEAVVERERTELARREQLYRAGRQPLALGGKTVVLVDDGLATGATMLAAIAAVRTQHPAQVVVGVPLAAPVTCAIVGRAADRTVCLRTPEPFRGVGAWYANFGQLSDDTVRLLLASG